MPRPGKGLVSPLRNASWSDRKVVFGLRVVPAAAPLFSFHCPRSSGAADVMNHHVSTVLIVDDDEGHAILIRENLESAGLQNRMEHFRDGQAVLDFFARRPPGDT